MSSPRKLPDAQTQMRWTGKEWDIKRIIQADITALGGLSGYEPRQSAATLTPATVDLANWMRDTYSEMMEAAELTTTTTRKPVEITRAGVEKWAEKNGYVLVQQTEYAELIKQKTKRGSAPEPIADEVWNRIRRLS